MVKWFMRMRQNLGIVIGMLSDAKSIIEEYNWGRENMTPFIANGGTEHY